MAGDSSQNKATPKVSAPSRKSLFERQKAEAQAKRQREKEETAAVYEDFVKSFEDDGRSPGSRFEPATHVRGRLSAAQFDKPAAPAPPLMGPGKRHFTTKTVRGPAILGGYAPKPGFTSQRDSLRSAEGAGGARMAFEMSSVDDEDTTNQQPEAEKAAAKPTLRLASIPPGTSPSAVKLLIPQNITVDNVKIIPPSPQNVPGTAGGDKKLWSAIVTVSHDTTATDLDAAVSALQNRYLGWGYYLSISRHLSSAALNSAVPLTSGLAFSSTSHPFGARQVQRDRPGQGSRLGPPRGPHHTGIAPPSFYGASQAARIGPTLQVEVRAPSDLKQLKMIHKTIENLLIHGPEFEALLMSRPEVQKDEKWAWIWDSRSTGGVYYRWKLWSVLTGDPTGISSKRNHNRPGYTALFDIGPIWAKPPNLPRFEYTIHLEEFVSDEDYDSSEDEDSDREENERRGDDEVSSTHDVDDLGLLNPLQKAKLAYLLARLPTTSAKLRKGDIAGVSSFANSHASKGAQEVVDMIVANITRPFAFSGANPEYKRQQHIDEQKKGEEGAANRGQEEDDKTKGKVDDSAAKLVGLFLVSDILSTSSTSGVRHAWRYRQLFEAAFRAYKTFEHLGRLEKELGWGRLKIEKWRRSIMNVLHLWEGWCVFSQENHEHFVRVFESPPLTEEEIARAEAEKAKAEAEETAQKKSKARWKAIDDPTSEAAATEARAEDAMDVDIDGVPMADEPDAQPSTDGYDSMDGWPMEDSSDEDIDGQPMDVDEEEGEPLADEAVAKVEPIQSNEAPLEAESKPQAATGPSNTSAATAAPSFKLASSASDRPKARPRPKAADMFADSGSE